MPTVLWLGGLRIAIYANDHRPPHVHVLGDGHEAVFEMKVPAGPAALRENYGFKRQELSRIQEGLLKNLEALMSAWERIHGKG